MSPRLTRVASPPASRRAKVGWPVGLAMLTAVAIVVLVWGWTGGSDARTFARLPAGERARLFEVTRAKAEAFCANRQLEDRCRAELDLLAEFPECDVACRALVARHHPGASR